MSLPPPNLFFNLLERSGKKSLIRLIAYNYLQKNKVKYQVNFDEVIGFVINATKNDQYQIPMGCVVMSKRAHATNNLLLL